MMLLPIVIILGNALYIFTNLAAYKGIYLKPEIYSDLGINRETVDATIENVFAYINNTKPLHPILFSAAAQEHLFAIQELLAFLNLLFGFFLLCFGILSFQLLLRGKIRTFLHACGYAAGLVMIAVIPLWLGLNEYTLFFINHLFQSTVLPQLSPDDVLHVLYAPQSLSVITTTFLRNTMLISAVLFVVTMLMQHKAFRKATKKKR